MSRRYVVLDVFTDQPLAGNPLAVILDSDGLSEGQMQAIAQEFNFSETVFVLPPANPAHRARIRIFTPAYELPFAGHPTVGSAVLLSLETTQGDAGAPDAMMVLEEKIGPVRCVVSRRSADIGHAVFDVPKLAERLGSDLDRDAIADMLGLLSSDIGFENHVPTIYSAGVPFVFVPLADLDAIGRASPVAAHWKRGTAKAPRDGVYLYTRETLTKAHHFHARMISREGSVEDPATGSAAAAFAGVILDFDRPVTGTHDYTIEQGFEMGRPSLVGLEIDVEAGLLHQARIRGDAVVLMRGTLAV